MLTVEELMKASKTYEHGYDDCCEAGFKQALKVAAELGWDPWKIAVRKNEAMIVAANERGKLTKYQVRNTNKEKSWAKIGMSFELWHENGIVRTITLNCCLL